MEAGRRIAVGAVGLAVMVLTAVLVLRAVGPSDDVDLASTPSSIEMSGEIDVQPGVLLLPGDPPVSAEPWLPPPLADTVPATLPTPSVATIPLPDFSAGSTTGAGPPTSPSTRAATFPEPGVWVVKADGQSPILVSRGATAGVAAGGVWIAFVQGGTVKAVERRDLRTPRDLATGVTGTAAQGLPISGGRRGVAFLRGGQAVLVDPAAPGQPLVAHDAPGADAVAAEEDGEGRLAWADDRGLHVGAPGPLAGGDVQRGMLAVGHGMVASLQEGRVTLEGAPVLDWGPVDRLQTGPAGLVAGSAGRIRLRSPGGASATLLDRASSPVVTATRILYVSAGRSLATATLTGSGPTVVATAGAGRSITGLDLLDDATLVVTVS